MKLVNVTDMQLFAKVAIHGVEPYEIEVVLSSYVRTTRRFQPEVAEIQCHIFGNGEIFNAGATVRGRTEGTRKPGMLTRHATIQLAEDENGLIEHWPAYARAALTEVCSKVRLR